LVESDPHARCKDHPLTQEIEALVLDIVEISYEEFVVSQVMES
jgi:hypothetical protein